MRVLHLLPNLLHPDSCWSFTPPAMQALIAESEKGGRQFLKRFLGKIEIPIYTLNEHTQDLKPLLVLREESVGLISDAGLPCLADPGARFIFEARKKEISIQAYPGPSSIFLALMLSGLSGQKFMFHGYLERESAQLIKQIKHFAPQMTHIFIETPYRNDKLLATLLATLNSQDLLCVAVDLMGKEEKVTTLSVKEWKKEVSFHKRPAVFLVWRQPNF